MKRLLLTVQGLLLVAALIFGGGQSEPTTPVSLSITYNWFGADAHSPWVKWAFEDFSKRYPMIKLDLNEVPSDKYRAKVRSDFMGKAATDILLWYGGAETVDFAKQNLLLDVGSYLGSQDSFVPGVLEDMSYNGKYYGLPLCENFFALYINSDIYTRHKLEAPNTYEDLLAQVKLLKSAGIIPIMMPGQNHPAIAAHFFSYVANQTTKRGEFEKASFGSGGSYASPGFMKAAEIISELQKAGAFDANIDGIPMASVEDMFAKGQGGMYFIGVWRIGSLPKELRNKMTPIRFPSVQGFTEDPKIVTAQTEMGWIFNASIKSDKAKLEAARTFISYFSEAPVYQKHVELTDTVIPVLKGVGVSSASSAIKSSVELVSSGVPRPFLFYFQSPAQQRTNNEVVWNLINGRESPQSAIDKLSKIPPNQR